MGKSNLNDFLKPGQLLPSNEVMIGKALEILELSPHGQQLVNFAEKKGITIKIMATPQPVSYLPEKNLVYVGVNRNNPVFPSRFILMLAGVFCDTPAQAPRL